MKQGANLIFIARWIALLGYALALFLLLSGRYIEWILMLFPLWVLLISIYILIDNLFRPSQAEATSSEAPGYDVRGSIHNDYSQ